MERETESRLQNDARRLICWDMANSLSVELGTQLLFLGSREWPGYQEACKSWQTAFWKTADTEPSEMFPCWRLFLDGNHHLIPRPADWPQDGRIWTPSDLEVEKVFQTYILDRAIFLSSVANRRKIDPKWWKNRIPFLSFAKQFNDKAVFERLVQLTQKPSKETGQRTLTDWLRLFWFPGCFWAFSNSAISSFIKHKTDGQDPTRKGAYDGESVRQAVSKLKLWHPAKPRHDNLIAQLATAKLLKS